MGGRVEGHFKTRSRRARRVVGNDGASSDPVSCKAAQAGGDSEGAKGCLRGIDMATAMVRRRVRRAPGRLAGAGLDVREVMQTPDDWDGAQPNQDKRIGLEMIELTSREVEGGG